MTERADRDRMIEEALARLRAARQRIDPGVLDHVRHAIALQAVSEISAPIEVRDADTRVDRGKNMSTVMKFLQLNSEKAEMNRKVLAILRKMKN